MTRAVSIRHLILGLLTQQPMCGYDIKRFLKSLGWLVDSPSFGSIYPALRALQEDSLVAMDEVLRQGKKPRKIYTITEAGIQALGEWVDQPTSPDGSLRTFLIRLILAGSFSHTVLITHLQQRRSQTADHYATLKQIMGALDETADSGQRLAFDYGLALASVELAWLDSKLDLLSRQSLPVEVVKD